MCIVSYSLTQLLNYWLEGCLGADTGHIVGSVGFCFGVEGGMTCSNCIHGHQMGMIIQRCSSPQHLHNEAQNADLLAVSMNAEFCHHR